MGGAVETGCSDLYDVTYYLIIWYYLHPLRPPPTAPPVMNTQFIMLLFFEHKGTQKDNTYLLAYYHV